MKKHFLLFFLISISAFSQKTNSVDVLKEKDFNKDFFKDKKKSVSLNSFVFNNGNNLKIGDTITLGEPSGINANRYGNGAKFKAYDFMIYGTNIGSALTGVKYADSNVQGKLFRIKEMNAVIGMGATAITASIEPINHSMMLYKSIFITNVTRAVANKEIILKNTILSKDDAIKLLEEKKKLLDLQLIDQEEFDKHKNKLAPIILSN